MINRLLRAPRYPFVWLLMAYRTVISPLYGNVCRYYPSCSAYALDAFAVHGVFKGFFMTAWRLLRCNPWSKGGVDHVHGSEAELVSRRIAAASGEPGLQPADPGEIRASAMCRNDHKDSKRMSFSPLTVRPPYGTRSI
ncbi:membrane protein insertion efficiency factor YidD [Saxibacter everestensis]|uniref:membrane protein insertion efficiency factor YidD n=1 Tax=Saxibacter everestensis TaxID=2909229 RepID=UPI0032E3670C